ncbi:MAG: hypothetical protein IMZ66_13060 [Planctomycetes bacterium]|nr:hypothetical protein [Planctomycetota bacterium]
MSLKESGNRGVPWRAAVLALVVVLAAGAMPALAQPVPADGNENDDTSNVAKTWTNGMLMPFTIHLDGNEDWTKFVISGSTSVQITFTVLMPGEAIKFDIFGPDNTTTTVVGPPAPPITVVASGGVYPVFNSPALFVGTLVAGTYYMQVTNDETYSPTVRQYTVQYVEIPPGGLRVSQVVPSTGWTVYWNAKARPAGINGMMTVHTMLPPGLFVSQPYKVTVGLRDAAGNWVGSRPQVIVTDKPVWNAEHNFPYRGFRNLAVPMVEGQVYTVWARMTQTTSNAVAIQDFMGAVVPAADGSNVTVGTDITVGSAGMAFTGVSPTAFLGRGGWVQVYPTMPGFVTFQMWNGASPRLCKAVIGVRDAGGAWAGGEPLVLISDTPPSGQPGTSYLNRPFTKLGAPLVPGVYSLWLRMVQTPDNNVAIASFKAAIVAAPTATDVEVGTNALIVIP